MTATTTTTTLLVVILAWCSSLVSSFYLPGVAPQSWNDGDPVVVSVDALTSPKTRLPYDYYDFPFCRPEKGVVAAGETLGEIFAGARMESTNYDINMNTNFKCKVLCEKKINKEEVSKLKSLVDDQYVVNLMVDNLPGAMEIQPDSSGNAVQFGLGYWVGGIILDVPVDTRAESIVALAKASITAPRYVNNHIVLKLFYHIPSNYEDYSRNYVGNMDDPVVATSGTTGGSGLKKNVDGTNAKRIVRFEVHAYSIANNGCETVSKVNKENVENQATSSMVLDLDNEEGMTVTYTYGVEWISSETSWATRWDIYLSMDGETHDDVHWLSITNSILVAIFLSALVALILVRTLRKDLMRYNRIPTDEEKAEELEESGWKLVHGDVFRPPAWPLVFSVMVGSGVQCFWMSFATIGFAAFGFLSPANRGSFITGFLVLFILLGAVGGFYSARMYKTLNGTGYQATTFLTAFGFPGLMFAGFFIINLFVWGYGSSAAIPFTSMLAVMALWFGISVPLTFVGAFIGYGKDSYEHPTRVNTLPRQIPEVAWYMSSLAGIFIGGILPFGTVSIELYFIMTSIWFGTTYYYVFGFLLVVGLLLFVTLAEMSITLTYFQLCAEDYHWWWRSFFTSASVAFYTFLYACYFFVTQSEMDNISSVVVYFGYSAMAGIVMFLMCGAMGFTATYIFVRTIFGAIKVD